MESLRRLWRDESGATAIEYAFIAMLVASVLVAGLDTLSGRIGAVLKRVVAAFA